MQQQQRQTLKPIYNTASPAALMQFCNKSKHITIKQRIRLQRRVGKLLGG